MWCEHAFINDDLHRQGANKKQQALGQVRVAPQLMGCMLANEIKLSLQHFACDPVAGDEDLFDRRHGSAGSLANVGADRVSWHIPPPQQRLTCILDGLLDHPHGMRLFSRIVGQKNIAHAERAFGRKIDTQISLGNTTQEFVRQRGQYTGAIPGVLLVAHPATMVHAAVHVLCIEQNLMTGLSLDVADKSYATAIFLIGWVVQPLSVREAKWSALCHITALSIDLYHGKTASPHVFRDTVDG